MKVGKLRIELAKILTETTGFEYPPEGIRQSNSTVGARSRSWSDPHYFIAIPKRYGAVLASTYTMKEIINAHTEGRKIEIDRLDCIEID